ncbi:hypothetical protein U9M48_012259 [Paspalum notatum var. saurae]|uniref:RRM domain-containing protein n=1 Tax=Paspalum notatum var. saurae TaxID=547442 RepID=A0AAQ3SX46_PASNO
MASGLDMSLDDLIKQSKSRSKANSTASSVGSGPGPARRAPPPARAAPYPPPAPKELFSEVGELKRYSMNYEKDGKSKGTAEVVFARKVDALDAIKRYNGVLLDGKPMNIELIGNNAEPPPMPPLIHNRPLQSYNDIQISSKIWFANTNCLLEKVVLDDILGVLWTCASYVVSDDMDLGSLDQQRSELCRKLKEVVREEHLKAMVVVEAIFKVAAAVEKGKAEGRTGIAHPFQLQILTMNSTNTMQQR